MSRRFYPGGGCAPPPDMAGLARFEDIKNEVHSRRDIEGIHAGRTERKSQPIRVKISRAAPTATRGVWDRIH